MKLLDKYILKNYITSFLFAIAILAVVSCVVDYAEKVDDIVKNKAPGKMVLLYFITFVPHIIALLYPLFIFISTIFFTSKLAYRSEFIAIIASGSKITRILRPYIIGSIIIGSCSLVFNHFLVPMANKEIYNFEEEYIRSKKEESNMHVHIRLSPNKYIYVSNFRFTNNTGQQFTEEIFEGTLLKEKTYAETIQYIDSTDTWLLKYVTIRKNDGLKETLIKESSLVKKYPLVPNDLDEDDQRKTTLTTPQLYKKTRVEMSRGLENISAYGYELHRRFAESFAGVILTIIAMVIASRKVRGGSGLHLATGIVLSAIYLLFIQFTKTFSVNNVMDPMLAAWIPNIVFSAVAYFLLRWRMK